MLDPTFKPSRANTLYGRKTQAKREVLTAFSEHLLFPGLAIESQAVMPTLNRDYSSVDNSFRVSCVQWCGEQKSEGTPGLWDSYCLADSIAISNPVELAVLYFGGCAPARLGADQRVLTETKRAVGA